MDILGEDIKIDFNLNKKEEQGSADITWRMPSLSVARYIKLDSAVKVVKNVKGFFAQAGST